MRNYNLLLLFILLISSLTVLSCNSSDPEVEPKENPMMIGKWYFDTVRIMGGSQPLKFNCNNPVCKDSQSKPLLNYLHLQKTSKLEEVQIGSDSDPCAFKKLEGTWKLEGDTLTIDEPSAHHYNYIVLSVSETQLILKLIVDPSKPSQYYEFTLNK